MRDYSIMWQGVGAFCLSLFCCATSACGVTLAEPAKEPKATPRQHQAADETSTRPVLSPESTPLLYAAISGDVQRARELLADGGDPDLTMPDGTRPLHLAAARGHLGVIDVLVEAGADVNVLDGEGTTPLGVAVLSGRFATAKALMRHGGELNCRDRLPESVLRGDEEHIRALLREGHSPDEPCVNGITALHCAAVADRAELAGELISRGADVAAAARGGRTALHVAAAADAAGVMEILIGAGARIDAVAEGMTPLTMAVLGENVDACRALLSAGADPEGDLEWEVGFPLSLAVQAEEPALMDLLLDAGADPNRRGPTGWTALHGAAASGHRWAVKKLLAAGARVRPDEGGLSPVHLAITSAPDARIVFMLIEAGGDVNARDRQGETPLHRAVLRGDPDLVAGLLHVGADPAIEDEEGRTPADYAELAGQPEIAELLP